MAKNTTPAPKTGNQPVAKAAATANAPACGNSTVTPHVAPEKIAQRAFEKWLSRGCTHGCDKQDWHEAELELKSELAKKGNATTPSRR